MRTWKFRKPEQQDVQGLCCSCGINKQRHKGGGKFGTVCATCHRKRCNGSGNRSYRNFKKSYCSACGFIAEHECQLDVDHIDGNHDNDEEENLQTLCANCHRLKTHNNREYEAS